jgi:outer membrane protein TolC
MAFPKCLLYLENMKTKHLFFTALFLAILANAGMQTVFAEEGTLTLTIDMAVRTALDNNLSLRRTAINLGTALRAADRSWNSLLPTVTASAMVSHPTSITGAIVPAQTMSPDGRPQDRDVWTPGFSLSAGFTFSASVIENIKKTQADYQTGLLTYEAAQQELELSVRKLFYQILLLDANRELAAQNFGSAQARHEQTAALSRIGQAPRLDELSARVDMENQRPAMINAEILYENALDSFKAVLGIPAETAIKLEGDLSKIGEWGIGSGDWGISAGRESLEVLRLLQSIRSMEAQRNTIRNGAYIPSLRLSWTSTPVYNIQNDYWNDSGSFSISFGLSLDNFLPWSNAKTQIDALNDNIRAAEIQLTETLRNRENRVNQNMRTIARILESLEAIKLNVELAQSTYAQYEDAYQRGAADYQRLRNVGDSLEQAKNRLLQEQYNLIVALLDLEKELNISFGTLSN